MAKSENKEVNQAAAMFRRVEKSQNKQNQLKHLKQVFQVLEQELNKRVDDYWQNKDFVWHVKQALLKAATTGSYQEMNALRTALGEE